MSRSGVTEPPCASLVDSIEEFTNMPSLGESLDEGDPVSGSKRSHLMSRVGRLADQLQLPEVRMEYPQIYDRAIGVLRKLYDALQGRAEQLCIQTALENVQRVK